MADVTTEGLEVEELVADEAEHTDHEQHTDPALPSAGWPCQQRRRGRTAELPAPQRFHDLPIWMSAPARRPEPEEETV